MNKLTQIAHLIKAMTANVDTVDDSVLARAIGTVLFDVPVIRTGLVSSALLDEYGYRPSIAKCVNEHFHSRQESGVALIKLARDGATLEEMIDYIETVVQVHLTTKKENLTLSQIQNHPVTKDLMWQEQYELAGIELVADPGTQPIKERNRLKKEGRF